MIVVSRNNREQTVTIALNEPQANDLRLALDILSRLEIGSGQPILTDSLVELWRELCK